MLRNIKINFFKIIFNLCLIFSFIYFTFSSFALDRNEDWKEVLKKASGQTIYFHAWGGAKNINSYIRWASGEVKKKYNITVKHVKVSDTANVVAKIFQHTRLSYCENEFYK